MSANTARWWVKDLRALGILLGFLIAGSAMAFSPIPMPKSEPVEHNFKVEASNFAFTPAILSVNPGDKVTIELTSTDVVHGLYLEGYEQEISSDPGQTTKMTFIADRTGSFRLRCSVTCGALHPFMIGKLNVGPNLLLWRGAGLAVLAVIAGILSARR